MMMMGFSSVYVRTQQFTNWNVRSGDLLGVQFVSYKCVLTVATGVVLCKANACKSMRCKDWQVENAL